MPLRAYINNEEKISINYSDEEWDILKKSIKDNSLSIILPCCQQRGALRKSSKGLKHFIHHKGQNSCDWKPESAEHLKAKTEIIKACLENGWEATPEYSENDWRADVLATKDGMRIAFEIQWSNQTNDTTVLRQEKYKAANVRGCWFFRTIPKQLRHYDECLAIKEMPFFKFVRAEPTTLVEFNRRTYTLGEFTGSLLKGKMKFCENYSPAPNQEVEILFFDKFCWKCHEHQHLYTVQSPIKSLCGNNMIDEWAEEDIDLFPEIIDAVADIVNSEKEHNFKIGEIKMRYSNTVEDSYLSFGCYHCDALFGNCFLPDEKREALNSGAGIVFKRKISFKKLTVAGNHWCYSENKQFCE